MLFAVAKGGDGGDAGGGERVMLHSAAVGQRQAAVNNAKSYLESCRTVTASLREKAYLFILSFDSHLFEINFL